MKGWEYSLTQFVVPWKLIVFLLIYNENQAAYPIFLFALTCKKLRSTILAHMQDSALSPHFLLLSFNLPTIPLPLLLNFLITYPYYLTFSMSSSVYSLTFFLFPGIMMYIVLGGANCFEFLKRLYNCTGPDSRSWPCHSKAVSSQAKNWIWHSFFHL